MSRRRLFCSRKRLEEGVFTIAGEEAHHGVNVCRLHAGDEVFVFTEQGSEFRCEVVSARKGQLQARILEKLTNEVESPLELTLIQAAPKAARLEQIIIHGTELGLNRLVLVRSERSVAVADRPERWRRLALEATKQSGRRRIPIVEPASPLAELDLTGFEESVKVLACEQQCAGSLKKLIGDHAGAKSAVVAAGPEGGFTREEMRIFIDAGFACVSMGPRILRTETASLAILAALQYELGDWEVSSNTFRGC